MLKRIPKSDINIRPFKAYKEWSFSGSAELAEPRIELLEANISSSDLSGLYPQNSIYGQLRAQFYNDSGDNPFTRTGHKTKSYTTAILSKERFLSGSAKVISIPKIYVGEGMKKGSVRLLDNQNLPTETTYIDDSYGNLQNNNDKIVISQIDIESRLINFTDLSENVYSASIEGPNTLGAFDIQNGTLELIYNGQALPTIQLISLDINTGFAIAEDIPFLPEEAQGIKIGNVFYNQGLIVLTRESADKLQNEWQLDYKSTQTIYEHEYLLIVNQDEFNVSTNPSAVVEVGRETLLVPTSDGKIVGTVTNPGTKYIRKKSILENGNVLDFRYTSSVNPNVFAGFEHYELSSSVDSAGSFLLPFITTIGLYDDDCQLVAVAKLPQPIKSESDIPVNFIIRFDT